MSKATVEQVNHPQLCGVFSYLLSLYTWIINWCATGLYFYRTCNCFIFDYNIFHVLSNWFNENIGIGGFRQAVYLLLWITKKYTIYITKSAMRETGARSSHGALCFWMSLMTRHTSTRNMPAKMFVSVNMNRMVRCVFGRVYILAGRPVELCTLVNGRGFLEDSLSNGNLSDQKIPVAKRSPDSTQTKKSCRPI